MKGLIALFAVLAFSGCTAGQISTTPILPASGALGSSDLQLSVGTANLNGVLGLNTVVTFRQANGLSAVAVNAPTITGPVGFKVPAAPDAGADAGTNEITSTFGSTGGAFGYGFQPSDTGGYSFGPLAPYRLPFYSTPQAYFIGGPPAWPQVRTGSFPPGFNGFTFGFTDFAATPIAGLYLLSVGVQNGLSTTLFSAIARLQNLAMMAAFSTPTLTPNANGDGGATIQVRVPPDATEAFVIVVNRTGGCYPRGQSPPYYYTVETTSVGLQTLTLPSGLGASPANGTSAGPIVPTLCSSAKNAVAGNMSGGDSYSVYAVAADYPLFEASYPGSTSRTPAIAGPNGQADISVSALSALAMTP